MSSRTLLKLSPLPYSDSHSLPSSSLPGPLALASRLCSHGGAAEAMVIASVTAESNERIRTLEYPMVDLSWKRGRAAELLVRACEEFGFVKVVNHGVPRSVIAKMEAEGARFFALPPCEKHKAGPPTPLGYGIRSIGFNGDMGELDNHGIRSKDNPLACVDASSPLFHLMPWLEKAQAHNEEERWERKSRVRIMEEYPSEKRHSRSYLSIPVSGRTDN
ncbi:hypothetical protein C4D60_Mb11t12220 [Musa balbisiana]|uniref:Non-haem dioxygenase N-terminal domain-containing protein n=1 Tax=Musa balbisiana TaxID=52838 RepID=A0A4S8J600_MUSBA|nr:hypothetical protein C4D60_Mb11t12220 [Musa balbisiana]